jgi:hypothetical protein
MSAPSTVYSNNTLQDYTTTSNEVLTLLPLNLAEYNGNMRVLFYLSDVKGLKDKSDRDVLIGLVAEGSDNYFMRPSNRIGKGRIYKDGVTYAICNDGGLNTFAKAEVVEVIYRFANYIKVKFNHKAAYYSATHRAGVQITSENDAYGWEHVILTDKPAKSTQTVVDVIIYCMLGFIIIFWKLYKTKHSILGTERESSSKVKEELQIEMDAS